MASLKQLLAEDGFQGGKLKWRSRNSFVADTAAMRKVVSGQARLRREQTTLGSAPLDLRSRNERTRSDVSSWLGFQPDLQKIEQATGESFGNKVGDERFIIKSEEEDVGEIEIVEEAERAMDHRISDGTDDYKSSKDIFSFDLQGNAMPNDENSKAFHENERSGERWTLSAEDGRHGNRFSKPPSFEGASQTSSKSGRNSGDLRSQKRLYFEQMVSKPALDEAAIQATIAIISGYVRRFPKDNAFRASLRRNCLSCLGSTGMVDPYHVDSGVVVNFRHALESVERTADKSGNTKEFKKACLQLSVITGLNSNGLKDGFTSGVPNSNLAACAHLYLSVIYKLRKKDLISAKHLLQVFCDSPFQARTVLLPELWDQLFLPHLSHLRLWYDQEAEAISNMASRKRKLKHLDKVYNDILNDGTYQFAIYYKEWLTKGIEPPAIPSILTPKTSDRGASSGGSNGISAELDLELEPCDEVDIPPNKNVFDVVKDGEGKENLSICMESSAAAGEKVEGAGAYSPKVGTCMEQHKQQKSQNDMGGFSLPVTLSLQDNAKLLASMNSPGPQYVDVQDVKEIKTNSGSKCCCLSITGSATHLIPYTKTNELTLKELARAVFNLQHTEDFPDSEPAGNCNSMPAPTLHANKKNLNSRSLFWLISAELCGNRGGFFFPSIPKEFFCPMTGRFFEDPITLETGHTFERFAIKEWFEQGNRTCPATGQTLGSGAVPATNLVVKWVIEEWKSKHCRNLFVFATKMVEVSTNPKCKSKDRATILILEQLLTGLGTKENMENAKRLISLGGLQFLVQKLEFGDLEEKARTAALLCCCIKADGNCRNFLARNIAPSSLIQLLHNKQVASRTSALLLLTELICLNRRRAIALFLGGLQKGETSTLHVLLSYIQSSPAEQRPLVAVLLLHLVLLIELHRESIFGEEAVRALVVALECSLSDAKVREQSCRALSILGGHFSNSGEATTETWLINHAGFYNGFEAKSQDKFLHIDEVTQLWDVRHTAQPNEALVPFDSLSTSGGHKEEEEKEREGWWKSVTILLLVNGKNSFLETISNCLSSKIPELFQVCLTTVAWVSHALASPLDAEIQLSVFTSFIPQLKECLKNDRIEHRVLASMCLLNFSHISECQALLRTSAEEIIAPLRSLSEVTWTAKKLHSIISSDPC
ncbi:hypothetical protein ACLOJK_017319 [Asimina triloba]